MIKIDIDASRALARLDTTPERVRDALARKMDALRQQLEATIKDKLSGQVLNAKSGALQRSIFSEIAEDGDTLITARAGSNGDVKYAAIHEFGGKTAAHDILPSKAKALAFMTGGKQAFVKIVHHPGSVEPERSFIRSSLTDMKDQILDQLTQAMHEGARA